MATQRTESLAVSPDNEAQVRAWDGDEGDDWTDYEERYDETSRYYRLRLNQAARIASTDSVLDIGCGCGQSTRDAARAASAGFAMGIDLSARMLQRARLRAKQEGLTNISFERGDAQVYGFSPQAFDVAISRLGAMFFGNRVAAFRNIAAALRPGGRIAWLGWQEPSRNEWMVSIFRALDAGRHLPLPAAGAPPVGLADADGVSSALAEAGFRQIELADVREKFYFGATGEDAWEFFQKGVGIVRGLTSGLDETVRSRAMEQLRATLLSHETAEGVLFNSACWLVTAIRS